MGIDATVVENTAEASDTSEYVSAEAVVTNNPVPGLHPVTGEPVTYDFPSVKYNLSPESIETKSSQTSFALKVESATKSSGGNIKHSNSSNKSSSGGGGGGGGKSSSPSSGGGGGGGGSSSGSSGSPKKLLKANEEKERYHYINN
jgi:hypothetical protein